MIAIFLVKGKFSMTVCTCIPAWPAGLHATGALPGAFPEGVPVMFPYVTLLSYVLGLKYVQVYIHIYFLLLILYLPVPNSWQFALYLKRLLYHPTVFRLSVETGGQPVIWVILPLFWSLLNLYSLRHFTRENESSGKGYLDRITLSPILVSLPDGAFRTGPAPFLVLTACCL